MKDTIRDKIFRHLYRQLHKGKYVDTVKENESHMSCHITYVITLHSFLVMFSQKDTIIIRIIATRTKYRSSKM